MRWESNLDLGDVKRFSFSGGERHVDLTNNTDHYHSITARIRNSDDLMDLLLVHDVLVRTKRRPRVLLLPYMPYARQDRATTLSTPFSLEIAAKLINSMEFDEVHVFEPHSIVTETLIKNCKPISSNYPAYLFLLKLEELGLEKPLVVAPDLGAVKRVESFVDYVKSYDKDLIIDDIGYAIKKRDPSNGRLHYVSVSPNCMNSPLLILDDICDGGATFNMLHDFIGSGHKKALFVAHGIFSQGLTELQRRYMTIGTTDSFCRDYRHYTNNVYVYGIKEIL